LSTVATVVLVASRGSGTTDELLFRKLGDWSLLVSEDCIGASDGFSSGE